MILDGSGALVLGDEETPVQAGHVISRPAATGRRAHVPRRSAAAHLPRLRNPRAGDVCHYPRSNKIFFRGVGVMARLETLDYWDGED